MNSRFHIKSKEKYILIFEGRQVMEVEELLVSEYYLNESEKTYYYHELLLKRAKGQSMGDNRDGDIMANQPLSELHQSRTISNYFKSIDYKQSIYLWVKIKSINLYNNEREIRKEKLSHVVDQINELKKDNMGFGYKITELPLHILREIGLVYSRKILIGGEIRGRGRGGLQSRIPDLEYIGNMDNIHKYKKNKEPKELGETNMCENSLLYKECLCVNPSLIGEIHSDPKRWEITYKIIIPEANTRLERIFSFEEVNKMSGLVLPLILNMHPLVGRSILMSLKSKMLIYFFSTSEDVSPRESQLLNTPRHRRDDANSYTMVIHHSHRGHSNHLERKEDFREGDLVDYHLHSLHPLS